MDQDKSSIEQIQLFIIIRLSQTKSLAISIVLFKQHIYYETPLCSCCTKNENLNNICMIVLDICSQKEQISRMVSTVVTGSLMLCTRDVTMVFNTGGGRVIFASIARHSRPNPIVYIIRLIFYYYYCCIFLFRISLSPSPNAFRFQRAVVQYYIYI